MADRSPFVDEPSGVAEPDWGPTAPTSVIRSADLPAEAARAIDAEMVSVARAMKEAC